jgi:hypothetical protein
MYNTTLNLLNDQAKCCFAFDGNVQFYPNAPACSDIEIVALAITAENLEIDSENLLFAKVRTDYPQWFERLCHRVRYNKRRRRLVDTIIACMELLADSLDDLSEDLIVDSMPLPTAHIKRESRSKACRRSELDEVCANKAWHPSSGSFMIGYKLHLCTTKSGVYLGSWISPMATHDVKFLHKIFSQYYKTRKSKRRIEDRRVLADKGYDAGPIQQSLFAGLQLEVKAQMRKNRKDFEAYPYELKVTRKRNETCFSQLTDEFRIKRNLAKRFSGLKARVYTKLLARTLKQVLNSQTGRSISQTKHAFAA